MKGNDMGTLIRLNAPRIMKNFVYEDEQDGVLFSVELNLLNNLSILYCGKEEIRVLMNTFYRVAADPESEVFYMIEDFLNLEDIKRCINMFKDSVLIIDNTHELLTDEYIEELYERSDNQYIILCRDDYDGRPNIPNVCFRDVIQVNGVRSTELYLTAKR